MINLENLVVYTTQAGDKWLVATNTSPYFCFEAASEEAALAKASRAIRLVQRAVQNISERRDESAPSWHKVTARELAAVA